MITPGMLNSIATMDPIDLTLIFETSGYSACWFHSVDFKGINQSGDFCFDVTFDDGDGVTTGTAYLSYDHDNNVFVGEF
jgi:hypothetical protein